VTGLPRHSGAMPMGPREARPDDRLRIEPGISRFRVRIFDAPRNDDADNHPPFSAAASFAAFSSSTLPSSFLLAGGSNATPLWRGITCMWR
jgi:hypothetical protein